MVGAAAATGSFHTTGGVKSIRVGVSDRRGAIKLGYAWTRESGQTVLSRIWCSGSEVQEAVKCREKATVASKYNKPLTAEVGRWAPVSQEHYLERSDVNCQVFTILL